MRVLRGGAGDTVCLVHGLGGRAEDFFAAASILAGRHKVFIFDLPGFGLSDKPDAPYTAAWFEKVMAELARNLGLTSPAWVGHSMGGMLVLRLAALRPWLVSKVAAVCPAGGHSASAFPYRVFSLLFANRLDRLRYYHPRFLQMSFGFMFKYPDSPEAGALLQKVKKEWAENRRELEVPLVRSGRGIIKAPVWPLAGRITCPGLIITGRHDRVTPKADTKRLLENMPHDCNHIVMNCGHMPLYSMPRPLADHLGGFLESPPLT